jgi:protein ImuA
MALSNQLPGGGWPTSSLIDLMVQQPGIGEIRLLAPALRKVAGRGIMMITPPHAPQASALAAHGIEPSQLYLVRAERTADMLWAAEQALRAGSFGAVLFWQNHIRPESLRRLHLAAQGGENLFFMFRPMAAAMDTSPAPLRLGLRAVSGGLNIEFVKRRGPQRDEPLFIPLPITTVRPSVPVRHAPVVRPVQAPAVVEAEF